MQITRTQFLRQNLWIIALSITVYGTIMGLFAIFYMSSTSVMEQQLQSSLLTSAALAADWFSGEELDQINVTADME